MGFCSTPVLNQMRVFGETCLFTDSPLPICRGMGAEGSRTNSELLKSSRHKNILEHLLLYQLLDPSPEILILKIWGRARESALLPSSPVGLLTGHGPNFESPGVG